MGGKTDCSVKEENTDMRKSCPVIKNKIRPQFSKLSFFSSGLGKGAPFSDELPSLTLLGDKSRHSLAMADWFPAVLPGCLRC